MRVSILTLFPEYFQGPLTSSILKRAAEAGRVEYNLVNIRDFATDKHHITDDRPFGGGAGMVMKVEPIDKALESLGVVKGGAGTRIVLTSAKGGVFTQQVAVTYAGLEHLVIICGHYEGVDERVAEFLVDEEVRIGDYVLTGGEAAAAVMTDAVVRLLPGVLGNEESLEGESHQVAGQMGHPQYTLPREYKGWKVPEVLLSGNHKEIEEWRVKKRN